jgi:hypothetical protein
MIIYALGYIAVSLIFVLLYRRAYRKRAALELNAGEVLETCASIQSHLLNIGIGVLSILIVSIGGDNSSFFAGIVYSLVGPAQALNGWIMGKKKRKLAAEPAA